MTLSPRALLKRLGFDVSRNMLRSGLGPLHPPAPQERDRYGHQWPDNYAWLEKPKSRKVEAAVRREQDFYDTNLGVSERKRGRSAGLSFVFII
jgi:hypothetical protein